MNYYTREQFFGYMIMAVRKLTYSEDQIGELIYKVEVTMEHWTEEMAEQIYEDFFSGERVKNILKI